MEAKRSTSDSTHFMIKVNRVPEDISALHTASSSSLFFSVNSTVQGLYAESRGTTVALCGATPTSVVHLMFKVGLRWTAIPYTWKSKSFLAGLAGAKQEVSLEGCTNWFTLGLFADRQRLQVFITRPGQVRLGRGKSRAGRKRRRLACFIVPFWVRDNDDVGCARFQPQQDLTSALIALFDHGSQWQMRGKRH